MNQRFNARAACVAALLSVTPVVWAQPQVNISGDGAHREALLADEGTLDRIDVNFDGNTSCGGSFEQLAEPFDAITCNFVAPSWWAIHYRVDGDSVALRELRDFALMGQTPAVPGLEAYLNRTQYAGNGLCVLPCAQCDSSCSPICQASVDIAELAVPAVWQAASDGSPHWSRRPNEPGYGFSGIVAADCGLGGGTPSVLWDPCVGPDCLNFDTAAPDARTVFDTPTAYIPIAIIANRGAFSGVNGAPGIFTQSDLVYLNLTGRTQTGENLVVATRTVGSATRIAAMNSLGIDPTFAVGENCGEAATLFNFAQLGPSFQPSNWTSAERLETVVRNSRLGVGYARLYGPMRAIADAQNGQYEIANVVADFKGGTVPVRPDVLAVLNNGDVDSGWQIGGLTSFATVGSPGGSTPATTEFIQNFLFDGWPLSDCSACVAAVNNPYVPLPALSAIPDLLDPTSFFPNPGFSPFQQACTSGAGLLSDPQAFGAVTPAGVVPERDSSGAPYFDGSPNGAYLNRWTGLYDIFAGAPLSPAHAVTGDFNFDGLRTIDDVEPMVMAIFDPVNFSLSMTPGTPIEPVVIEVLGDFNGDGNFDLRDVRYFCDGLALDPVTGRLDRAQAFLRADLQWQALTGTDNLFGTIIEDCDGAPAPYVVGASAADVAGGSGPDAFDGIVNCVDGQFIFDNAGDWLNLDDAVAMDLSADQNGDLLVDSADLTVLSTYMGCLCFGPQGACCLPGAGCANETQTGCALLGGVFQGAGTDCATANCEPLCLFAQPRSCIPELKLPITGSDLGRSPRIEPTGTITETPGVGLRTRTSNGSTAVREPLGGTQPRDDIPMTDPEGDPDDFPEDQPVDEEETPLCEPKIDFPDIEALPIYRSLLRLAGVASAVDGARGAVGGVKPINFVDLGAGLGWNYGVACVIRDPATGRYILIDKDLSFTTFVDDGLGGWTPSAGGFYEFQPTPALITVRRKGGVVYTFEPLIPAVPLPGEVFFLRTSADRNGNLSTYNYAAGRLVTMIDPDGRQIAFTHYPSGHVQTATDDLGRTLGFEYDPQFRLTALVLPNGERIEYAYNAQDMLTQKTLPDGQMFIIDYAPSGTVTLRDPDAATVVSVLNAPQPDLALSATADEVTYAPGVVTVVDGDGEQWQYAHNARGQITQLTDPGGNPTDYQYDPLTRKPSAVSDCLGNITQYEYDARGNVTRRTDALGQQWQMTYDPIHDGLLTLIEPDGDLWVYEYDPRGNLTRVIDPLIEAPTDLTLDYVYDPVNGDLLQSTDRNGNVTTYAYTDRLLTTRTVDPFGLGLITTYEYDAIGRRTATVNGRGMRRAFVYDEFDRVTQITVDAGPPPALNLTTSYTFDLNGNLTQVTDPRGFVTEYDFDARGRITTITQDPTGIAAVTQFEYDGRDNQTRVIDPVLNETTFEYDAQNRLFRKTDGANNTTTFGYDCADRLVEATDQDGRVVAYAYDGLDRRVATTMDPSGLALTTQVDYAAVGCGCGTPGEPLVYRSTDADGRVEYFYYDELDRRVRHVRKINDVADNGGDADDIVTHYTYDGNGNIRRVTMENAPGADRVVEFEFDALDRQVRRILDPGGLDLISEFDYDGAENLVLERPFDAAERTYTYDAVNRLTSVADPGGVQQTRTYDANGNLLTQLDANGNGFTYQYDGLNRRVQRTDAQGVAATLTYDAAGRIIAETDRNLNTTRFEYDGVNRRTRIITPLSDPNPATQFTYDAAGRKLTQTDAVGNATTYTYDPAGRVTQELHADGGMLTYTYDGVGNRLTRTDPNGDTTAYTYDDIGRLVMRSYTNAPSSPAALPPTDTYMYDRLGNLLSADNATTDLDVAYDPLARATSLTQGAQTTTYVYVDNPSGTDLSTIYPTADVVTERRNGRRQVAEIQLDGVPLAVFNYDAAGRVQSRSYPQNGTATTFTYSANTWVTGVTHTHGGGAFAQFAYDHDSEGNQLYARDLTRPDLSELYQYDAMDRLVAYERGFLNGAGDAIVAPTSVPGAVQARTWDGLDLTGNWTDTTTTVDGVSLSEAREVAAANRYAVIGDRPQAYDANGNRLLNSIRGDADLDGDIDADDFDAFTLAFTGPCDGDCALAPIYAATEATFDFDRDGDIDSRDFAVFQRRFSGADTLADGVTRYIYDIENRLRVVETADTVVTYEFDALNRLVRRTVDGQVTEFVVDAQRRTIVEDGPAGVSINVYGAWIDDLVLRVDGGTRTFYHRDAKGHTVALTDDSGDVVEQYAYDPYGRPLFFDSAGLRIPSSAVGNDYLYTGRRYEAEVGLYYYRARHFDPLAGRFVQRDPIGFAGGDNLYEYVSSNPIGRVDPLGLIQPGFEQCTSKSWNIASGDSGGSIGPVSWSASFSVDFTVEACIKCCEPGTARALQWVVDVRLEATVSGSASATAASVRATFFDVVDVWAGLRVSARISGSLSGEAKTDRCNNREFVLTLCAEANGSLTISGGAGLTVRTYFGDINQGADITGRGSITARKCLECTPGGCSWQRGEVCLSGRAELNINILFISETVDLWSGRECFSI